MANRITLFASLDPVKLCCRQKKVNDHFESQQIKWENERYEIQFCGYLLNLQQLQKDGGEMDIGTLIAGLYARVGQGILKQLKGSYTLAILDKKENSFFVSNDLLSKKGLYYHMGEGLLFASNSFFEVCEGLKERHIPLAYNQTALGMMMQEGFLWGDATFARQIKYLRPFEYLYGNKNGVELKCLENTFGDSDVSYQEALEGFDRLFNDAVTRQWQLAQQEGTGQLASLSAGMDSRGVVLTACQRLGLEKPLCFTYAQSGSVDDRVARDIAVDFHLDHIFYELDSANFLFDADSAFPLNEGQQTYCGSTGARAVSGMLDKGRYSVIHTGILGGELMGDVQFSKTKTAVADKLSTAGTSCGLDCATIAQDYSKIMEKYSCSQQLEVEKHLRGSQNFSNMVGDRFEAISPFLDEEVYCFLTGLDTQYKYGRRLYIDWMNRYLPNDYITTYCHGKLKSNELVRKARYAVRLIKGKLFGKSRYDMNPFDYWAKNDPTIATRLSHQLEEILKPLTRQDKTAWEYLSQQAKRTDIDGLVKAITAAKAMAQLEGAYPTKAVAQPTDDGQGEKNEDII